MWLKNICVIRNRPKGGGGAFPSGPLDPWLDPIHPPMQLVGMWACGECSGAEPQKLCKYWSALLLPRDNHSPHASPRKASCTQWIYIYNAILDSFLYTFIALLYRIRVRRQWPYRVVKVIEWRVLFKNIGPVATGPARLLLTPTRLNVLLCYTCMSALHVTSCLLASWPPEQGPNVPPPPPGFSAKSKAMVTTPGVATQQQWSSQPAAGAAVVATPRPPG